MSVLAVAASGMRVQENRVNIIANNLANATTTGFSKSMPVSGAILGHTIKSPGALSASTGTMSNTGLYFGGGSETIATVRILEQGPITQTSQDTHLAVMGQGYFQVELPDGTIGYTRDGNFNRGPTGELETVDGFRVLPGITIPSDATKVMINKDGQVEVRISGQVENQIIGQIQLSTFTNPGGLDPIGRNNFVETTASGAAIIGNPGDAGFGKIQQYALEGSNVDSITAVTEMIDAQRTYEMLAKAMKTGDEMQSVVSQRVGA